MFHLQIAMYDCINFLEIRIYISKKITFTNKNIFYNVKFLVTAETISMEIKKSCLLYIFLKIIYFLVKDFSK